MMATASDVSFIGDYHLQNLRANQVSFYFFDLRDEKTRGSEASGHPLLVGSIAVPAAKLVEHVRSQQLSPNAPIVLLDSTGSESVSIARELEQNGFINVFVVQGGAQGLRID